jgi:hypothetical protein
VIARREAKAKEAAGATDATDAPRS